MNALTSGWSLYKEDSWQIIAEVIADFRKSKCKKVLEVKADSPSITDIKVRQ